MSAVRIGGVEVGTLGGYSELLLGGCRDLLRGPVGVCLFFLGNFICHSFGVGFA